jgi:aminopeptidase N
MLGGILGEQKQIFDSLLEVTVAHEVAHQWWAIGVGSDSQRAPWLDESLTNYSAMIYFEDRYGAPKAQQMIDLHLKTSYSMGRMLGNADAPVNKRTSQYGGNIQYGAIVYGKGALFYDALRKTMGDAAFFDALRNYYARNDNGIATANDLMSAMQNAAPDKAGQIRTLYGRWIEGAHGDEDISGGKAMDISDLLGGMMGGMADGMTGE